MSVNKVILLGNIGQQPEVRALPSGQRVATFGVATSDRYKDKQTGEPKELTEWHNCVAWGQQCEFIERYLGKGSKVYVEGRLRSRDYTTQRGEQRRVTEIVVDRIESVGGPATAQGGQMPQGQLRPAPARTASALPLDESEAREGEDDLPF